MSGTLEEIGVLLKLRGRPEFTSETAHAEQDVKKIGTATQESSVKSEAGLAGVGGRLRGLSGLAVKAAGVMGLAAGAFGVKSVKTYQEVGRESIQLQRSMGGTIEQASRLRFAAEETGVSQQGLTTSLRILSRNLIAASKDQAVTTQSHRLQIVTVPRLVKGHLEYVKALKDVVTSSSHMVRVNKDLGFSYLDAHGKLLPMNALLMNAAEHFKEMPNGPEKTALAMKLFGRQGAALLPFLNRGREGIAELNKESDKLGNTLSQKDVDAIRKNIIAKRQWHATITGLQIQIGRNLTPALASFTVALQRGSAFVSEHSRTIKPLLIALAALTAITWSVNKATSAYHSVSKAFIAVKKVFVTTTDAETGAESKSLIMRVRGTVATIAARVQELALTAAVKAQTAALWLQDKAMAGLQMLKRAAEWVIAKGVMIATTAATKAWAAGQWLLNAAMDANPIGLVVAAIAILAVGLIYAYKHSEKFRAIVQGALHGVEAAGSAVYHFFQRNWPLLVAILTGPIGIAVLVIVRHWRQISNAAGATKDYIVGKWNSLVGFVTGLPARMGRGLSKMWDGLKDGFREAINYVIDAWNNLQFKMPSVDTHIPHIGKIGGFTLGTPDIPRLHSGGSVSAGGSAIIKPDEELVMLPAAASVVPLQAGSVNLQGLAAAGGNRQPVVLQVMLDRRVLAEAVYDSTSDKAARA